MGVRFENLREGEPIPERVFPEITQTDIVRYAGAGGDMNPIHHDPAFAAAAGLDGVFAMGMLPAGMLGVHVAEWLGPENCRRFATEFRDRVWPGDTIICRGIIRRKYIEDGERLVDLDLEVVRQAGRIAIKASATFVLHA